MLTHFLLVTTGSIPPLGPGPCLPGKDDTFPWYLNTRFSKRTLVLFWPTYVFLFSFSLRALSSSEYMYSQVTLQPCMPWAPTGFHGLFPVCLVLGCCYIKGEVTGCKFKVNLAGTIFHFVFATNPCCPSLLARSEEKDYSYTINIIPIHIDE